MANPIIVSNPALYSKEELIALFAVRVNKFKRIFKEIKSSADKTESQQHWLIVGERGMGKTTMLHRIAYEIENDNELRDKFVTLIFPEEQYGVIKLFKLWELIAQLLSKTNPLKYGYLPTDLDRCYKDARNNEVYEERAFRVVFNSIERENKKLVLFIDNFGDMLASFSDQEKQRFREVLMTYPYLKIIAGSATVSESFYLYKDPLFESFNTERLTGLNKEESQKLLLRLGEFYKNDKIKNIIDTQPQRIEVLRRLTGGNPRIIILLFKMLLDNENLTIYTDFITLLDGLTQFYNLKTSDLKGQRLEIVNTLALNWDAMAAKEIADKMRETSSTVSSLIKQMEKDDIVERVPTKIKNHLYIVKDRFYNIWFLMRNGFGDAEKAKFLVKFFDEWLSHFERMDTAELFINVLRQSKNDGMATRLGSYALIQSNIPKYAQQALNDLLLEDGNIIQSSENSIRFHKEIYTARLFNPLITVDYTILRNDLYESPFGLEAKSKILQVFENFNQEKVDKLQAILRQEKNKLVAYALNQYNEKYKDCRDNTQLICIADALLDNENTELAIHYLSKVKENECNEVIARKHIATLFSSVGTQAIVLGEKSEKLKQEDIAKNYFYQAEESYLKSNRFGNNTIYFELGRLYETKFKDYKKANENYQQAHKNSNESNTKVLHYLGWSYLKIGNTKEAEKCYLEVLKIEPNNSEAFRWLGNIYSENHKTFAKSESYYLKAIEANNNDANNSIAWLYFTNGIKKEEALVYIKLCYKKDHSLETAHTYACILLWNDEFETSYEIAERFLYSSNFLDNTDYSEFIIYLLLACAKEQYEPVYNFFTSERGKAVSSKDRFRPIYFALMNLMKDKYPNEYLRMGSELKETVDEILIKILEMKKKYA